MKIRTDQAIIKDRIKITNLIANFWDKISEGWRIVWGPHIHHGFYEDKDNATPLQAQEKLIEKLIELLDIKPESNILDVGCGMGGSSIYLAKKFLANVTGITLSQKQVSIASEQALIENVSRVNFKIEDALSLESFADNTFDLIWSLESCEQFFDKNLFIKQAFRVLKPGGKFILATWCSDRDEYQDKDAKKYQKLCFAFDVPYMPTIEHYYKLLQANNFTVEQKLDWTTYVAPSWDIGINLLSAYSLLQQLKLGGWRGLRFVQQVKLMRVAFREHRVKYGVFLAIK